MHQRLDGLTRPADYCERAYGDDDWIFDAERVRELREEIAERLSSP